MNTLKQLIILGIFTLVITLVGPELNATNSLTTNTVIVTQTKGTNVTYVNYGAGTFIQNGPKTWKEFGGNGNSYSFEETHRDEWSVYLVDRTRNVNIQLDLYTKKVMYSVGSAAKKALYTIQHVSDKVNGRMATYANIFQSGKNIGRYIQTGDKTWKELSQNPNGQSFNFTETHRDDWSVYLVDRSRNVNIQLDFHTLKVMYSVGSGTKSAIYTIQGASGKINGRMAKEAIYTANGKSGNFMQTSASKWAETNPVGTKYSFTEVGRDDWSVYLEDRSRNVAIQLDYHTMEVKYGKTGQNKTVLYKITGAK